MIVTSRSFALLKTTGAIGTLLLVLSATVDVRAQDNGLDDGWRRTKDGWEQMATWNLPTNVVAAEFDAESFAVMTLPRWQGSVFFHPAMIAISLVAIAAACLRIPGASAPSKDAISN
ncbi:hypothetical protein [Anatilimnocola aggregata]|uniref:hypothetical protein n=1 Tax=Anatilimnocola aggregata TaxID=2528021 RepID=UPI00119EA6D5|nr:hypothetical protein [Anatilimnocola aggregata]